MSFLFNFQASRWRKKWKLYAFVRNSHICTSITSHPVSTFSPVFFVQLFQIVKVLSWPLGIFMDPPDRLINVGLIVGLVIGFYHGICMLSLANTTGDLFIVTAYYLNHHLNLVMQVTHIWITRSKILRNCKLGIHFFYHFRLNGKPGSQVGIKRIKNSQDLKSYKRLEYIFYLLSNAFRSFASLVSTIGTATIITELYFVLGKTVPLFERLVCLAGLIMFAPSAIFAWTAAGKCHEKCKIVICRLKRS